ncbi:MAG TPA: ATP-binding protein [Sulfurospirillum sp. UBA11407]|nr:MAG TPA: ATP-binding protein [Sulfurospirillum sp. UBA11407]
MNPSKKNVKALALFSGGLDSMIAIKLLTLQGIEVIALYMDIGFGSKTDITQTLQNRASLVGAKLHVVDIKEEYIRDILFSPKYGYGKHFNPCIDCHGYMFKIASSLLDKLNAQFIISGEVLGQRPMSQRSDAMRSVKKLSGLEEDLILRPMSAKHMPLTKPEIEGWVDRDKLLGITGRGRDTQLALAKEYGWEDFQSPGGGCLLTDPRFSEKLKEFLKYESLHVKDVALLKAGRHLRLPNQSKLIIGRDQAENEILEHINHEGYLRVKTLGIPGPFALLSKSANKEDKNLSARLVLTFCKTSPNEIYTVEVGAQSIQASPFETREEAHQYLI